MGGNTNSSSSASEFGEESKAPLFQENKIDGEEGSLVRRVLRETKNLWDIAAPAIFNRVANYSMLVITQVFVGHLGDLELASTSVAINVILGLDLGIMLGMSSALETLCGQAFGAKKYYMLGVYMQRSWVVLFTTAIALLPIFLCATPILKFLGQPPEIAELAGTISLCIIPIHFVYAFYFPLYFFLQSQLKNKVIAWVSFFAFFVHLLCAWLTAYKFKMGVLFVAASANVSWIVLALAFLGYILLGNCPDTWTGFSMEAFSGLSEFAHLSAASGVMICLEIWYDRALLLLSGNLPNAAISLEALTICLTINVWQMMFPMGFFAAVGVRVANELGAGNGKGAKLATLVSVANSFSIGILFLILIIIFRTRIGYMFSSSIVVIKEVNKLSLLLAFTILLNSIQPVLSGIAIGSGWQKYVAYINLGCYYLIGVPLGVLFGFVFHLGVEGIWGGLIFGGTAVQTLVLAIVTLRSDWDKEAERARLHVTKWEGAVRN
ncbi:hypothetical protein PIB30_073661 [Stylosanthes scabra]|uniref:Protein DETOXIFICATION n=1 Tax=Stylosanthes scabra TaxID=79078 RepID=A0ABU6WMN4_9FABA|nr:hypothetical protein [Stylosanthes scabra]